MQFTQDIQTIDALSSSEYVQSWKEAMMNLPHRLGQRIDVIRISDDYLCEKYKINGVSHVLFRIWDVLTIRPVKIFTNKYDLLDFLEEEQNNQVWQWKDPV